MSTKVADDHGKMIDVEDLAVPADRIYNFVQRFKKTYFEDHGLDWALDEILTRGMAEITRQVKTAATQARQRAAGKLLDAYNLTPEQAKEIVRQAMASKQASNGQTVVTSQTPQTTK